MKRASGGKVVYAGAGSNVLKEAEERKRGGKIERTMGEGDMAKHHAGKRARGGTVIARAAGGKVSTPGRKRGGGIGANLTPLSTAARISKKDTIS